MRQEVKECLKEFILAKRALGCSMMDRNHEAIRSKLVQVINSAIELKCVLVSGKKIPLQDTLTAVKYRQLDKDSLELISLYDIFMPFNQLPLFAADPGPYLLKGSVLAMVYIFGLNEDFAGYIAPHILKLEAYGIGMIRYFSLDDSEYSSIDPIDYTYYLINIMSEPANVRSLKRGAINNGVCSISSLSQIRNLKNLVNLVG